MLLPRMKLARLFDEAFHAMADLHWTLLFLLISLHAVSTWVLFVLFGETELTAPATFFYWYATTAYTVGYGDLSPSSDGGRLITALWVFPGAIAAFTTVVAKVLAAIGEVWRLRRAGKGDYSRMTQSIVLIGHHAARTPKMIAELCSDVAHVVCYFEDEDHARLIDQHCPEVEVILSAGPELVARACKDPGASQVISALTSHLDASATLFSLQWPDRAARPFGDLARVLLDRGATLLAIQPGQDTRPTFNPPADRRVEPGDRLFYVASNRLDASAIAG
ncbi:potassium channel family protein [Brevundimonas sp. DC300-4]|uniref:potassium channel family protein n=1 Tax=Brevundimonas sp. DC300-4 TaxID=2804594 RepID=UPI003CF445AA